MLRPLDLGGRFSLGEQLRRLTTDNKYVGLDNSRAIELLRTAVAADHAGHPRRDNLTIDDLDGGLCLLVGEREYLDQAEVEFIEVALDRGESLTDLAKVYGLSRPALTKRYEALGGTRTPLVGNPPRSCRTAPSFATGWL